MRREDEWGGSRRGAYRERNPNALFAMRTIDRANNAAAAGAAGAESTAWNSLFFDGGDGAQLALLKQKIRARFASRKSGGEQEALGQQVFDYTVRFEENLAIDETQGSGLSMSMRSSGGTEVAMFDKRSEAGGGLESVFAPRVEAFFRAAIAAQYPVERGQLHAMEVDRQGHQMFLDLRGENLLPPPAGLLRSRNPPGR